MLARIVSNNDILLANMTTPEEDLVMERFTITVDNRFANPDAGGFNGIYRRYDRTRSRLARPYLGELRALCAREKIPLVVKDERPPWKYKVLDPELIGNDFLPVITLEQYQINAIRLACKVEVCIFDIPTGGGKTEIMAGICKAIPCTTVILADQRIVIDQIKQRLELRDVIDEVGLFYAGQTPTGQMIIAGSVQSLQIPNRVPPKPQESDAFIKARKYIAEHPDEFGIAADSERSDVEDATNTLADKMFKGMLKKYESVLKGFRKRKQRAKQFQEIVKKAEMLIVDECDLASNNQYKYVFRHLFKGRRRYGFSGTPFDPEKPVEALFLQEHLGSVLMKVERKELEDLKRIVPIEFTMFAIGDTPKEASTFDIAVREKMVENEEFHKLVATICRQYKEERTLVLVERDALGEALLARVRGMGLTAEFIHGKTPKRRRDEVLRAFERQEIGVVIGGKIIRRGLDLKGGCENLVIATGGKLWSTFNQQIGRAVRINARGIGRVFDFLFLCNKYLYKHSRARLKAIVGMGYKTRVVFPNGQQLDGPRFIASGWRRPKPKMQVGQRVAPPKRPAQPPPS